jgi:hypothetical protein
MNGVFINTSLTSGNSPKKTINSNALEGIIIKIRIDAATYESAALLMLFIIKGMDIETDDSVIKVKVRLLK